MSKNLSTNQEKNIQRLREVSQRLDSSSVIEIEQSVREIIEEVKKLGDLSLAKFCKKFDNYDYDLSKAKPFHIEIKKGSKENFSKLNPELQEALIEAKERITEFHKQEINHLNLQGWSFTGKVGEQLGIRYSALDSVAIYIPGGQAALISTVLMTAIPAKAAGVKRIVLLSPPPISTEILAAAELCELDEIIGLGGAQAIAALSYGTETITNVDKIVGPGNIYVSLAKKYCFGKIGIDGIYGPSELAILADNSARADFIASDLLSQLEHGSGLESVLLVSLSEKLLEKVKNEIKKQIDALKTFKTEKQIQTIQNSYEKWSALLYAEDLDKACELINIYAPEHLEIQLEASLINSAIKEIKNAGAIFIGNSSSESLGDYIAGPSHCLPTGGSARFSSGLQTIDFIKRSSIIDFSKVNSSGAEFKKLNQQAAIIARAEKLEAHARAAELRIN